MRHYNPAVLLLAMIATVALTACGARDRAEAEARTGLAGLADKAVTELREELATRNLRIGDGDDDAPRAEISPQGDLIIGGEKVALDAGQQALVLEYRANLATVAEAGAQVGLEGAALAATALKESAKGVFGGDRAQIEKRIEAEADGVRESARKLCDLLPALHAAQRAVEAAVPEFAPYANMDENDIKDCYVEAKE